MLCGGNTVIMCGTRDMGRKVFSVGPTFFVPPPPPRGGHPRKKYPTRYQKNFSSPPPWVRIRHKTNVVHKIYTMGLIMTPYGDTLFIPIVLYTLKQKHSNKTCNMNINTKNETLWH